MKKRILQLLAEKYPSAERIHHDGVHFHVIGRDRMGECALVRADMAQVKTLLGL